MAPEFTWRCDVCREERPDDKINIRHIPIKGMLQAFPGTRFNMKHCNDKTDCVTEAEETVIWNLGEDEVYPKGYKMTARDSQQKGET